MARRGSRIHHVWREALYDQPYETHTITKYVGEDTGKLVIAIYGDTYDEVQSGFVIGDTATATAVGELVSGKGWHIERIVGDITYRGWRFGSSNPASPGYTPIYTIRSGLIVVESDGALGVPIVELDDRNPSDIEANWMFLEQFHCNGADAPSDGVADGDANLAGLNDFVVSRHYDIRVGRRMNPHDVLLWRWMAWYGPYANATYTDGEYAMVTFSAAVRMLVSR